MGEKTSNNQKEGTPKPGVSINPSRSKTAEPSMNIDPTQEGTSKPGVSINPSK